MCDKRFERMSNSVVGSLQTEGVPILVLWNKRSLIPDVSLLKEKDEKKRMRIEYESCSCRRIIDY